MTHIPQSHDDSPDESSCPEPRHASERYRPPEATPAGGVPRWARRLGIIIVLVALAVMVVLHLTGALGPGLHG